MSEQPEDPLTPEDGAAAADAFSLPPPGVNWVGQTLRALALLLAALATLIVGARLAVLTDPGRQAFVALIDGQSLGPVGRLRIQGLTGDLFGRFQLARLQVADKRGVWLDVRDLSVDWSPEELAVRRLHVKQLSAGVASLVRAPTIPSSPRQTGSTRPPVSIIIDAARFRLDSTPVVTLVAGRWTVSGRTHIRRLGASDGEVTIASQLRAGDGLAVRFRLGDDDRLELKADGSEQAGGALSGALGLIPTRPMRLSAAADGVAKGGKLRVALTSGAEQVLDVDASWGQDGGALTAMSRLDLSTHTAMFAKRIGPEAKLTGVSRRLKGDHYLIDGKLTGPLASLVAHGPVNLKTRKAEGVTVTAVVDELARWWVPVPHIGPTRTSGLVTGDLDRFDYVAQATAEKIQQNDLKIARAFGPIRFSHEKGEFRLVADLKSEGVSGDGLLWALLGPKPVVRFDGGRVRDGRYLFHKLTIRGSHLDVDGDGGWTLTGDLDFKGKAVAQGVGLGRAGKGTLTGTWDAIWPKGAEDWSLKLDAKGQGLVTGAQEFDRLVGPAPVVSARAKWTARGLEVSKATAKGAAIEAALRGLLNREGALDMDLDWSARGPAYVAGLEIAGAAHGKGRVTGDVASPRADLEADLTSVDLGQLSVTPARLALTFIKADHEVDGAVSVTGKSKFGEAIGKAAFRFTDGGFELHDLVADAGGLKISGAMAFRDGAMVSADVQGSATQGAFLRQGRATGVLRLSGTAEKSVAVISLNGANLAGQDTPGAIRQIKLSARGPLDRLPFDVTVNGNDPVAWSFQGSGVFSHPAAPEATLTGVGRIRKAEFKLLEPALIRLAEHDKALKLKAALSGGQVELDLRDAPSGLAARGRIAGVSLQGLTEDYLGVVSGTLNASGADGRLGGKMDVALANARSRDAPADQTMNAQLSVDLNGALMRLAGAASSSAGLQARLDLDLPAEASARPFRIAIDRTKPVTGAFRAQGELRPLWDLLAGGDRSLSGAIAAQGALSGPLARLRATGDATLSGGQFRDAATGLLLKDLSIAAKFNSDEVVVRQMRGTDDHGGVVSGDGRVSLSADGASTLKLVLSKFRLIDNEIGRAQASGALTVTRDGEGHAKLAGALTVDRADIAANPPTPTGVTPLVVRELHREAKDGEDAPQPRTSPIQVAFDVTIKAARGIFVRGKGLDAELSLDSHVTGDSLKPDLTGVARLIRGSYDFSGKRFDFDELGAVRLGPTPETIRLDLTAQREDPSLTAQIRVSGTAAKPQITLTSTPVLPQDEVLSRVLFGVAASQLSPFQAAQLASALTSLATGGGFDIIGGLRQFARLDRLSLGVDQSTVNLPGVKQATTISGGKYLTDNVYVELTGGGRTGPSAQVELRVRRNLSFISQIGAQGDARLSVRFRQNF